MVKLQTVIARLLVTTIGFCRLYGYFAEAVMTKSINDSSQVTLQQNTVDKDHNSATLLSRDRLETSQSRVNQLGSYNSASSVNRVSNKGEYFHICYFRKIFLKFVN